MTQEELRQRLKELILEAPKTDIVYGDIKLKEPIQTVQTIVDHLISNGVTIRERGEWIKLEGDWKDADTKKPLTIHQCLRCGSYFQKAPYNFCPHCGAEMRGVKDE